MVEILEEVDLELHALPNDPAQDVKPLSVTFALIAPIVLEACGGGGSAAPTSVTPPPPPPPVAQLGAGEVSRFLAQATMGPSKAEITALQSSNYDAWLTTQLGMARATKFYDWLTTNGHNIPGNVFNLNGFDAMYWAQFIGGADQLRQRVGLALMDMFVVGVGALGGPWRPFSMAAFADILWDNAFGNFRELLEGVAGNVAMGEFLTFQGNRKATARTVPDENFARELLQLFTIGLFALEADGTLRLSGGNPVETYGRDDISGLARVWTGYIYANTDTTVPDRYRLPMIQVAGFHELGVKTFLGTTIPAGTDGIASRKIALDTIFAHPNVPPFISKQLIQHLVTSNPSPAYVGRVSAIFANNGSGVRGDLKAVIRAILTDSEARDTANQSSASFGKLREPIVRLTNWARATGVTSPGNLWPFGDTSSQANRLSQSPGRASNVFNFFRPGYTPAGSTIAAQNLVAPEFQMVNEPSTVAYINHMQTLIQSGAGEAKADYAALQALATDSQALLNELNLVLAANQISAATIATLRTALDTIAATTPAGQLSRVYAAVLLVMAAPEYLVLK